MPQPVATIVVVPREQFRVAPRSLEMLYEHSAAPFRLVYVDGGSPRDLRATLDQQARERGFELIRSDDYLSPNAARNLGLERVETEYVVFVDNDLLVSPGWLDALIACAEDTGAWAVGPLYLEGDPADRLIHMAGGAYRFHGSAPLRKFETEHLLQHRALDELPEPLSRRECDFAEFHCMLVRREVFERLGPLDPALLNTREHLDLCIQIRDAGGRVFFEPASVVTYRTPPPLDLRDIPFFMLRWSDRWTRSSLRHFAEKYQLDPSYQKRASIAAARRAIVFEPLRTLAARLVGERGSRGIVGAMSRIEQVLNRLVVRAAPTTRRPG